MAGVAFKVNRALLAVLAVLAALVFVSYLTRTNLCQTKENTVRISELIAASIDLSERGGEEVRAVRRGGSSIGQEVKGKTSVHTKDYVTQGDKRSHEAIVAGLRARWANLKYVSEERVPVDSTSVACPSIQNPEVIEVLRVVDDPPIPLEDVLVWIDPLDATQEYTEGGERPDLLRFVTVMMCVCVKGEPVAGVIHQAFEGVGGNGVTHWGWKGHGFSRSIQRQVDAAKSKAKGKDVEKERVEAIVSRSHAGDAKKEVGVFCAMTCAPVCVGVWGVWGGVATQVCSLHIVGMPLKCPGTEYVVVSLEYRLTLPLVQLTLLLSRPPFLPPSSPLYVLVGENV